MLGLISKGIPFGGVHDSVIVPAENRPDLIEEMAKAAYRSSRGETLNIPSVYRKTNYTWDRGVAAASRRGGVPGLSASSPAPMPSSGGSAGFVVLEARQRDLFRSHPRIPVAAFQGLDDYSGQTLRVVGITGEGGGVVGSQRPGQHYQVRHPWVTDRVPQLLAVAARDHIPAVGEARQMYRHPWLRDPRMLDAVSRGALTGQDELQQFQSRRIRQGAKELRRRIQMHTRRLTTRDGEVGGRRPGHKDRLHKWG